MATRGPRLTIYVNIGCIKLLVQMTYTALFLVWTGWNRHVALKLLKYSLDARIQLIIMHRVFQ